MIIVEFCDKHNACADGRDWALSCGAMDMHEIWQRDDLKPEWRMWVATRDGVLTDRELRLFACWAVRQVWHLLTDERSRNAVEVSERFADGSATNSELKAALEAAREAAGAAGAAGAAAWAAAGEAQSQWLRQNTQPNFGEASADVARKEMKMKQQQHPTLARFIRRAANVKCTAKTTRGLVSFFRSHPEKVELWGGASRGKPSVKTSTGDRPALWSACSGLFAEPNRKLPAGGWKRHSLTPVECEKLRVSNDKSYRAARLRELRRICRISAAAYSPERWEAAKKAQGVAQSLGLPCVAEVRNVYLVPVGFRDLSYGSHCKDAKVSETFGLPRRDRTPGETHWKNGVPKSYTRAQDDNWVLSAARVTRDVLTYWFQEPGGEREVRRFQAPEGMRWDRDDDGVRLVHGRDDYHPGCSELRCVKDIMGYSGTDFIVGMLKSNAARRAKMEAENSIMLAECEGVRVTLADSVASGNCEAGTLAFAARCGITDRNAAIPAARLLDLAADKGDVVRVRLAVRAAIHRHRDDVEQGVDAVRIA